MKKEILKLLNKVIEKKGFRINKYYEILHLKQKYLELIDEMERNFSEILNDFPQNHKRRDLIAGLYGTGVSEAMYLVYYLNKALILNGDVCEFGIANGATSSLIANEIKKTKKNLWLFDSFKGLSKPTKKDRLINDIFGLGSMDKYEGTMSYGKDEVLLRLGKINFPKKRTRVVEGYIEKTINNINLPQKVCFAFIDFDLYEPIKTGLKFLDKALVKGGYVIVDDYGYFSAGAKKAVDEFLDESKSKYIIINPKKFAGYFCILQKIK